MEHTLIILALLPLAFGASLLNFLPASHGKPISMNQEPEHCCSPDQFEGLVFSDLVDVASDGMQIMINKMNYSYDATNKRTNMVGTTTYEGQERSFRVLTLFDQKRLYSVDYEGKCTYTEAGEFVPMCVPENATYVGRFKQGMGSESFESDLWKFQMPGFSSVLLTTTPNNCVMVNQVGYGDYQTNGASISALGLLNPTPGIRDPAVFTPPSGCQPGNNLKSQNKMVFGL